MYTYTSYVQQAEMAGDEKANNNDKKKYENEME